MSARRVRARETRERGLAVRGAEERSLGARDAGPRGAKGRGLGPRGSKGRSLRARLGRVLPWVAIVLGLAFLIRPVAQQWWEAWQASRGIDAAVSAYDAMDDPEREAVREEARRYNRALAAGMSLSGRLPYEEQLSWRGSEMIAYITVAKCAIKLPIYHGTEDRVLMAGVGHLRGTSLPVGGPSSHCVLTAHTGMPTRRMFDDIGLLVPGDTFVVWVLGEPLAYRVVGSEVVLPDDTSSVGIVEGQDLCTLVTCTPYGVNSHRLLVHARRCPYTGEGEMADLAVYVNRRTLPLLAAIAVLLLLGVWLWWRRRRRRRAAAEGAADGAGRANHSDSPKPTTTEGDGDPRV